MKLNGSTNYFFGKKNQPNTYLESKESGQISYVSNRCFFPNRACTDFCSSVAVDCPSQHYYFTRYFLPQLIFVTKRFFDKYYPLDDTVGGSKGGHR